jgi:hypothetical protein
VNASNQPNPAGLLGVLQVEFAQGDPLLFRVDKNWRTTRNLEPGWTAAGHDDSGWIRRRRLPRSGAVHGDA